MKTWLKGGIIAIILMIILITVLFPIKSSCKNTFETRCAPFFAYWELPLLPSILVLEIAENFGLFLHNDFLIYSIAFLVSAIIYFLIGALVGLIYGKIKSKKHKTK